MPLYLWLMLGGVAAYLVVQGGKAASASAVVGGSTTLQITAPNGQVFSVPVDAGLPAATAQQIQTFFHTPGQTDAKVGALSTSLAGQGYTVASGSVQNVWQMIQQGMGPLVSNSSSSGASGPAFHIGPGVGGTSAATAPTNYAAVQAPTNVKVV